MQLTDVDWLQASRLARSLLLAAKSEGISNHFALAKRIGVDQDSVVAVLKGGRPNTRTAERYKAFLTEVASESTQDVLPETTSVHVKKGRKSKGSRRPSVLPPLGLPPGLGFHQQLTGLSQALIEVANQLMTSLDRIRSSSQLVKYLLGLSEPLDADPVLKGVLDGDPVLRGVLAKMLDPAVAESAPGSDRRRNNEKSRTRELLRSALTKRRTKTKTVQGKTRTKSRSLTRKG